MKKEIPITFLFDGDKVEAVLFDNETTQDLISRMPYSVRLADTVNREKYGGIDTPLAGGENTVVTFETGGIVYWPSGPGLAIFYAHDGKTIESGIVTLGKIVSGLELLRNDKDVDVTFAVKKDA